MLSILPWNAYDKTSANLKDTDSSGPSDLAQKAAPDGSQRLKRKRSMNDDTERQCRSLPPHQSSNMGAHGNGPVAEEASGFNFGRAMPTQKPSEGLPTPLLSPTESPRKESAATDGGTQSNQSQSESRVRQMKQVISQQINLEVLLKHNELRLIDQELAKCQTALEQLRRCTEIPYPSSQLSANVSSGQGPTLKRRYAGARLPASPAPWGVVDGPYARHYAQWLLPDSRFDGGEPEFVAPITGKRPTKSRQSRAIIGEDSPVGVQSRSQRGGQLKALPAGYGQPKEKVSGPLLLKRKSDGVMVKLVCPDCGRHDFGSAQGFINHCRIGHSRTFASHDAAAEACGELVELDANGFVKGEEPLHTPATNNVHPLVRSARLLSATPAATPKLAVSNVDGSTDLPPVGSEPKAATSPDFRESSSTPFLSALVKGKGLGLNLEDIVADAKVKTVEPPDSEEEGSENEQAVGSIPVGGHRHPLAGARQVPGPSKSHGASPLLQSRMPTRQGASNKVAAPVGYEPQTNPVGLGFDVSDERTPRLDPSPTSESNQAPSLIDDDEEYEPHSPASSTALEPADEAEVHFQVQDDDENQQLQLPRSEFQPSCTQAGPQAPEMRGLGRPSALRKDVDSREEKHVSFSSPSREADSSNRKKRRTNN